MLLPFQASSLRGLSDELDGWRAKLDYRGPLPRAWTGRLRRDLETEAVAASVSMEGVPVTVEEVRRILVGERPTEVRPEDAALVEGYRDAMGFVLRRSDDPAFRWHRELIVALHDKILAGSFALGAGGFRTGPVYVVNGQTGEPVFLPPDPEDVPGLVDQAGTQLDAGTMHPAVAAAWAHVAIAAIHPFRDGNGRVARVLASVAMYRGGFKLAEFTSLEEWWGHHLADYYSAFTCLGDRFEATADVTPFVRTHMEAQLHQVRSLDLRERVQRRIWTSIEEAVTGAGMEPRVANAVWDAFFGREVTPRYYRPLADVSTASASTDLAAAVASGLLKPLGKGRSRRYVAGDEMYTGIGGALGIEVSEAREAGRSIIVAELTRRVSSLRD